jgi:hypothetical protein
VEWFGLLVVPGDKNEERPKISVRVERDSASLFLAEARSENNVEISVVDEHPLIAVHAALSFTMNNERDGK